MEEFILAGLLFHVGAAASLALVSAVAGMIDAHRRKPPAARAAVNTAEVIELPGTRPARAPQREAESQSKAA
jgi:hypothetical protein